MRNVPILFGVGLSVSVCLAAASASAQDARARPVDPVRAAILRDPLLLSTPATAPTPAEPPTEGRWPTIDLKRRPLQSLGSVLTWFSETQRRGDVDLYVTTPRVTRPGGTPWLPEESFSKDVRPAQRYVAHPPRYIGVPILVETHNYQVPDERGHDGMVLGFQIPLPWRIP
jgi:hypothetical protein